MAFNGTDSLDTIVGAWNILNPTNGVEHNAIDGADIPEVGEVQLYGGYPSYTPISIWGNAEIGKVQVSIAEKETYLLRAGIGKSFTIVVDKGDNPSGIRNVGSFEQKVDIKESHLD